MTKSQALQKYFGHSEFRPGQEELIDALLAGRDVLGIMPTGAGKSVCYQLPALLLPGLTLVISPLISLMKDQVTALRQNGIEAGYLNSSLSPRERRQVLETARQGGYRLLYVAPERLLTEEFLALTQEVPISLAAVDEAHCISQWGQDFRPSYLSIGEFLCRLPQRPPVGAFTATATEPVREDIKARLGLQDPLQVVLGYDRPNLRFEVQRPVRKDSYLRDFLQKHSRESGIIYCATRKTVEKVCERLQELGYAAARYHAGLSPEERKANQEDFLYDRVTVMVATNAFGMGIDKSNVSYVLHYNMPKNLESYYQEAGRAGRDGEPALCVLLYSKGDVRMARLLIEGNTENEALSLEEREENLERENRKLERMVGYCETQSCLRAYILNYFGETHAAECGNCGNCLAEYRERDITVEAQKILSAVVRVEKHCGFPLGSNMIVHHLRGSRRQRLLQLGLQNLSTQGVLHGESPRQVHRYVDELLAQGYLRQERVGEENPKPVLRLGPKARGVLFQGEKVFYRERFDPAEEVEAEETESEAAAEAEAEPETEARPAAKKPKARRSGQLQLDLGSEPETEREQELLDALKALRNRLAARDKVPAYLVFTNASLTDMLRKMPQSRAEFLQVSGVGEKKAECYAEDFLELLREYAAE